MKHLTYIVLLCFTFQFATAQEVIFELNPNQSMVMTGKGPGQDGAINPYINEDCIAYVKNIGTNALSVRIQTKGKIIKEITVKPKEEKNITLLKGYELYFDTDLAAKVVLDFKQKL